MFYLVHPERRQRRPHWPLYSKWFHSMDLPPALYWRPAEFKLWSRRDLPVLPGEILELVVVLTDDRPRFYHGLALRSIRDRVRVLRRVRLMKDYTYEELFQSALYAHWKAENRLEEYPLRPLSPLSDGAPSCG